jgi:hypothetical protein
MRGRSQYLIAGVALLTACQPAPRPVAPAPVPVAPVIAAVPAPDTVWTAGAGVVLRREGAEIQLARPFMRLDVIGADSVSLLVRCAACPDTIPGWVRRDQVIHESAAGDSAGVAHFALAVRRAAAQRDIITLRPMMATDFAFSALGSYGRDQALSSWISESFRTLDLVPGLLDGGLTLLNGWWVAPPGFANTFDYRALRLGFHQDRSGRWEWGYLVQGERP